MNIYQRQMKALGLNTNQYAELIEMPIGVVKNFIEEKEGGYDMGLRDLLRKNMLDKHQEIETNYEEAKIKATEIKYNVKDKQDKMEWYDKEYSSALLRSILKLSSITDFERKYRIMIGDKRASHWYYTILCGKREYDKHTIEKEKKNEFISQLYDILVNGNADKYKEEEPLVNVRPAQNKKSKAFYLNWYRTFDCKKFVKENHISSSTLEKELGFSPAVISRLINKRRYSDNALVRLYDFVYRTTNNIDYFNWFKDFDLKEYMAQNNLTNSTLGMKIGLGVVSTSHLANKRFYTKKTLEKLYEYINSQKATDVNNEEILETLRNNLYKARINGDKEEIDELENKYYDKVYQQNEHVKDIKYGVINDKVVEIQKLDNGKNNMIVAEMVEENNDNMKYDEPETNEQACEINSEQNNNDILRKILASRLTEEEKELIRIFGGKI